MRDNLYISNNPCLESITVNGQSFYNLNSLTIENNPQLNSIVTKDSALYYVQSVTISSIFYLMFIIWIDLPNLSTFTTGSYSFRETTNLILDSMIE